MVELDTGPDVVESSVAATRRAWLVMGGREQAAAIGCALREGGWQVDASVHTLAAVHTLLGSGLPPPQVIVSGVRFDDGDAMRLIRLLTRRQLGPALFFASHQQRAVIKAAAAMAAACGVPVAGVAEQPVDPAAIAKALAGHVTVSPPPKRRIAPPLERAELFELIGRGALHPWLQPKLRLATGEVTGFEALLLAHDAEGRLVMPDRLVGALSQHGLLDQATLQMARQTVDFVATCLGDGLAVSASINVSMQSLSSLAFCQELEHTVASAGLDPSWITIEITETDAMADLATVIENTARIRMLGFNLSIDDFGTAYSSLMQLSQIPFSELKIERNFVAGIAGDPVRQAIVRSCAELGAALGLHVVAEGVETRDEMACVQRLGCSHVQGYLASRPLPAQVALQWLRELPQGRLVL